MKKVETLLIRKNIKIVFFKGPPGIHYRNISTRKCPSKYAHYVLYVYHSMHILTVFREVNCANNVLHTHIHTHTHTHTHTNCDFLLYHVKVIEP